MTMDITSLVAQGQAALIPRPGEDLVTAAARAAGTARDPSDPPVFFLQAAPTWQGGVLPDGVIQRVPIGVTGQVLMVQSDGSIGWANSPSGFANPMTALGSLISGGAAGLPTELLIGAAGTVLTSQGGVPAWAPAVTGFVNPMSALGDLIAGGAAGAAGRLGVGSAGQVLTVVSGQPAWANAASGFANPMTTAGDIIIEGAGPAATRLPVGAAGQVLTVSGGLPSWQNSAAGFANPMTNIGDLITGSGGGAAQRLAAGATGQVLAISGGVPAWVNNPGGFANPMSAAGDLIVGGAAGAATRLAQSATNGQSLQVVNGAVAWATQMGLPLTGPSGAHPTVFRQPDGSIVVIPLSTYSISGDDSAWINAAFNFLPQIAGGSGQYGGTYNGPWIMGTVRLLPADYTITAGIVLPVNAGATINLLGHGPGTRLFVGTGAIGLKSHVAMGGPQAGHPAQQVMGTIAGLRFDGSGAGNNSAGIEIGGGWGRHIDVQCVNFGGSGCIGAHFTNTSNVSAEWMEKCRIQLDLMQNTTACVIENGTPGNSSADSFEYNDISLYIIQTNSAVNNGPGLVLQGGAFLSGGSLKMRGNFPTNSGPALVIQGNDTVGGNSNIFHQFIDITLEGNAVSALPQTVFFGTSGSHDNKIINCTGLMTFQFGGWSLSNISPTPSNNQFQFGGVVDGDTNLQGANSKPNGWL